MRLVGCAFGAPEPSRCTPLVGWSWRAPASPSPLSSGQGRESDSCFPGSGETPHPRAVVMLRVPIGLPREPGTSPLPAKAVVACGGEPLPGTGHRRTSSGVVRIGASRRESVSWLQGTLLTSALSSVLVLPMKQQRCTFSSQKKGPAASLPSGSAERRWRSLRGWLRVLLESGMELFSGARNDGDASLQH